MYVIWIGFLLSFAGEGGGKIFPQGPPLPWKTLGVVEPVAAALLGAGKGRCSENESKDEYVFSSGS